MQSLCVPHVPAQALCLPLPGTNREGSPGDVNETKACHNYICGGAIKICQAKGSLVDFSSGTHLPRCAAVRAVVTHLFTGQGD